MLYGVLKVLCLHCDVPKGLFVYLQTVKIRINLFKSVSFLLFAEYAQCLGHKVINHFSCSTQLSMKIVLLINVKMPTNVFLIFLYLCIHAITCELKSVRLGKMLSEI